MDTLRSCFVQRSYKILVNVLCHERNHRSCSLGNCYQSCVKSHVRIDLILLHAFCPETLTAASYIPVTHLVYKALKCSCSLRNLIVVQIFVNGLYKCIQLAEEPFVHNRKLVIVKRIFGSIKVINICIKYKECISIPQCTHEFTLSFLNSLAMETVRQPWCTVDVEVPADGICTVCLKCIKRINCISLGLAHLLAILILNMSKNDNVLIWSLIKQKSRLSKKGVEPSSCLVNSLRNKVCRELLFEQFLILKWIMMLCKWHCS